MAWWTWLLGAAWAVLFWVKMRRARHGRDLKLTAGATRDLLGRGGF